MLTIDAGSREPSDSMCHCPEGTHGEHHVRLQEEFARSCSQSCTSIRATGLMTGSGAAAQGRLPTDQLEHLLCGWSQEGSCQEGSCIVQISRDRGAALANYGS